MYTRVNRKCLFHHYGEFSKILFYPMGLNYVLNSWTWSRALKIRGRTSDSFFGNWNVPTDHVFRNYENSVWCVACFTCNMCLDYFVFFARRSWSLGRVYLSISGVCFFTVRFTMWYVYCAGSEGEAVTWCCRYYISLLPVIGPEADLLSRRVHQLIRRWNELVFAEDAEMWKMHVTDCANFCR